MDAEVESLRWLVHSFLTNDVLPSIQAGDAVLEVGPAHAGSCPVPEAFVDVRAAVEARGGTYVSIDPDPRPRHAWPGVERAVVVGVAGFEPTASSSRTKRATKLRHTPRSSDLTGCRGCPIAPVKACRV